MSQTGNRAGERLREVRVFAPATIGNVGPGFDILGLAVTCAGDEVVARVTDQPGVHVIEPGHPELPSDPSAHTSAIAAADVLRRASITDESIKAIGIELSVAKGLPLSGGQGGSAASAVAGAVAANALLGNPLSADAVMSACLVAESKVAGRHLDNIAPCVLGGCVLIRAVGHDAPDGRAVHHDVYRVPTPGWLRVVLAHPQQRMRTAEGRAVLPTTIDRHVAMAQAANVAALVLALTLGDEQLLARSIEDHIAEPARAPLLHGFREAKAAALSAGALGCSISGSGPTAFALAREETAPGVAEAMRGAYGGLGIACNVQIGAVDAGGARVM